MFRIVAACALAGIVLMASEGSPPQAQTAPAQVAKEREDLMKNMWRGYYRDMSQAAKGEGDAMELGQVLKPLSDFRKNMLFIRGLFNAEALKGNIHSSQTGNLLSGAPLASGGEIRSGTSIDQVIAQRQGHQTKVPSLVLGCEKSNPSVHKNYSMLYSSHISWSSPTTPTPLELYPALAFDRLFKDEVQKGDKSVLDAVLADAQDFRRQISTSDQRKLDEYLDSVREVEQRILAHRATLTKAGQRPALTPLPAAAQGVTANA